MITPIERARRAIANGSRTDGSLEDRIMDEIVEARVEERAAERQRMMKIVARDEFYPTLGCMDELRPKIVDAINGEGQK